ncbi:hypothetical protein [Zobellia laminariae]|uniref:hypothetical protein n=1 Tax=Zobellia laminariae TaxID=248906 RepID=UPI0026F464BE|nr:hypothetical protein [Zobellia laminariae]WKX77088.1 hypothetical protein Q5W13_02790 [Zobellia laminariae]
MRILEEGEVKKGDELVLVEQSENRLTVKDFYQLLFMRKKDPSILQLALTNESLPEYKRERLKKYLPKT